LDIYVIWPATKMTTKQQLIWLFLLQMACSRYANGGGIVFFSQVLTNIQFVIYLAGMEVQYYYE